MNMSKQKVVTILTSSAASKVHALPCSSARPLRSKLSSASLNFRHRKETPQSEDLFKSDDKTCCFHGRDAHLPSWLPRWQRASDLALQIQISDCSSPPVWRLHWNYRTVVPNNSHKLCRYQSHNFGILNFNCCSILLMLAISHSPRATWM